MGRTCVGAATPVELGAFDGTVAHCMGVELDDLGRVDKSSGLDASQRMAQLIPLRTVEGAR